MRVHGGKKYEGRVVAYDTTNCDDLPFQIAMSDGDCEDISCEEFLKASPLGRLQDAKNIVQKYRECILQYRKFQPNTQAISTVPISVLQNRMHRMELT